MPQVRFEITGNSAEFEASLGRSAQITEEMVKDFKAINDGMEGVIGRAERIKGFFTDNVDLIEKMKQMLELIASINEANQAALSNNLQAIREMLTSVGRMGGSIQDAARLIGTAGAHMGGGGINMGAQDLIQQFHQQMMFGQAQEGKNAATQAQAFRVAGGEARTQGAVEQRGFGGTVGGIAGLFKKAFSRGGEDDDNAKLAKAIADALRNAGIGGGGRGGVGAGGGGGYGGPAGTAPGYKSPATAPMPGAAASPKLILPTEEEARAVHAGTIGITRHVEPPVAEEPGYAGDRATWNDELRKRFPAYARKYGFPYDEEHQAGSQALANLQNNIAKYNKGIFKPFAQIALRGLPNDSDLKERMTLLRERVNLPDPDNPGRTLGNKAWITDLDDPNSPITKALSKANKQAGNQLLSPMQRLATRGSQIYAGYQGIENAAGLIREYTGQFAQQQGNVFGTVDYGRSAGLALQANEKSFFGLNPFYSTQDAMQAQMQGAGIGYRGGALNNYQDVAYGMQTRLGMTQGQIGQALGTTAGYNINVNQAANTISSVRNAGNGSSFYNASYATQTAVSNMATAASIGLSSSAAARLGTVVSGFAGNAVAKREGFNGTELMGSSLGLSVVANSLGVPISNLYSITAKMGGKQYLNLYTGDMLQMLSNSLGVNLQSIGSQQQLVQANVAYTALQVLNGMGISQVTDEQGAIEYLWLLIQQFKSTGGQTSMQQTIKQYGSGKGGTTGSGSTTPLTSGGSSMFSGGGGGGGGGGGTTTHTGGGGSTTTPTTPTTAGPPSPGASTSKVSLPSTVSNPFPSLGGGTSGGSTGTGTGGTYLIDFASSNAKTLSQILGLQVKQTTNGSTQNSTLPPRGVQ